MSAAARSLQKAAKQKFSTNRLIIRHLPDYRAAVAAFLQAAMHQ